MMMMTTNCIDIFNEGTVTKTHYSPLTQKMLQQHLTSNFFGGYDACR